MTWARSGAWGQISILAARVKAAGMRGLGRRSDWADVAGQIRGVRSRFLGPRLRTDVLGLSIQTSCVECRFSR